MQFFPKMDETPIMCPWKLKRRRKRTDWRRRRLIYEQLLFVAPIEKR